MNFDEWIAREFPRATGYERDLCQTVWIAAIGMAAKVAEHYCRVYEDTEIRTRHGIADQIRALDIKAAPQGVPSLSAGAAASGESQPSPVGAAPEPLHGKDAYQNSDGGDDLVHRIRMQLGRSNAAALGTREDVLRAALGGLHIVASEAVARIDQLERYATALIEEGADRVADIEAYKRQLVTMQKIVERHEAREALPPYTAADMVRADQAGAPITMVQAADGLKHAALDKMVDRFLAWPLPASVCSDTCVTIRNYDKWRCGTNLLTADEAWRMFEYVVYGK